MTSIISLSQIDRADGALGYSYLRVRFDGQERRETVLYLRDGNGWICNVVILPADIVRRTV